MGEDRKKTADAQAAFPSIFGMYKEVLGLLNQITNTQNRLTREDFGRSIRKMSTGKGYIQFKLPKIIMYTKLSSANQSGKLSGVYQQSTSSSMFSGYRNVSYTTDFFENLQKKAGTSSEAKSITIYNKPKKHNKTNSETQTSLHRNTLKI